MIIYMLYTMIWVNATAQQLGIGYGTVTIILEYFVF